MLTDAAFDRHCFTEPFGFSAAITFFENVPGRFNIFQGSGRHSGLAKVTGNSVGYTGVSLLKRRPSGCGCCARCCRSVAGQWIQRSGVSSLIRVTEQGVAEPTSGDDIKLPTMSPWEARRSGYA